MWIGRRVPFLIVDAIEDAEEIAATLPQNALKAVAKLGCLDLLGVLAADGSDGVRVDNAAFQKVHCVVVFKLVEGEHVPGQQQFFHRLRRKPALITGVVDCEHSRNVTIEGVEEVSGTQQHSKHGRLPVVRMEDIGNLDHLRSFNDCAAKQTEAFRVVGVVAGGRSVEAFAVEQFGAVDEVRLHSRIYATVEDANEAVVGRERNGHARKNDRGGRHGLGDLPVVRNKYADLVAEFAQGTRKRAHHICQAARLSPWSTLRCCKYDMHFAVLFLFNQTVSL